MSVLKVSEYKSNYEEIANSIAKDKQSSVKIVCVSKSHPVEALISAYEAGMRVFGENYVQEMVDKHNFVNEELKSAIEWHYIGHLQTNKVKYIAPFVDCIHSVYKLKLAKEIDKRAKENNRTINILIQINISHEDSKSGCEAAEAADLLDQIRSLENIKVVGLMAISGLESTDSERREQFSVLRNLRDELEKRHDASLPVLSMGMTSDYQIAIEEGSTMIRIGTALFGKREYTL